MAATFYLCKIFSDTLFSDNSICFNVRNSRFNSSNNSIVNMISYNECENMNWKSIREYVLTISLNNANIAVHVLSKHLLDHKSNW